MTSETSEREAQNNAYEAQVKKVSRTIRHIGFAIFGGISGALVIFLLVNTLIDLSNGEVRDPYTHKQVQPSTASTHPNGK